MKTADFDYALPPELIAQRPAPDRDGARMLVLDRASGARQHRAVRDLPAFLRAGDALVLNDSRVIPARLFGVKPGTGGRVEVLFLEEEQPGLWLALYKAAGGARPGARFRSPSGRIRGELVDRAPEGRVRLRVESDGPFLEALEAEGTPPLPPYIRRPRGANAADPAQRAADRERYQTVFARQAGSVAAPTAGLHFSRPLLEAVQARGATLVTVTLHVGLGTFKPIAAEELDGHVMHEERYDVTPETAACLNRIRETGGRWVAVGTTSARVLETATDAQGILRAGAGRTRLFIRPPYRFKGVDALLTNFHLPRSTLLVLVSALAGWEAIRGAYAEAVRERYRFFSYGDCMLIQ